MPENSPSVSLVIRFGPFDADLQTQELRKHGVRLRLPGQSFQILKMLLERPGNLVTRDALRQALWPSDTFVDFDHSLNAAVNRLREALSDSADEPRLIETLPRRGYRFIGTITTLQPRSPEREAATNIASRRTWPKIAAWTLAGAIFALGASFAYRRSRPEPESPTLTPLPFTSFPGEEASPAFSPDGSRIAFAWNGDPAPGAKGFDLYVKAIGSETLIRLTRHPSEFVSAAWSPDGTRIAFHRISGANTGIYDIPALGGPERKLLATRIPFAVSAPISWSPDGKWIAYTESLPPADDQRIHLLSLETLESRQIPHVPECLHEGLPAFSHGGGELAYSCMHNSWEHALYSVATSGGSPKLIVTYPNFPGGISWTTDDKKLLLSQGAPNGGELDEVVVETGALHRLPFGQNGSWPAISPKGEMLAFSISSDNVNIWRKDLVHPNSPAEVLISSTRDQGAAQYSPDGKHIAFQSSRAGVMDVWVSGADGANAVQVSKFDAVTGTPRWSPDNTKLAFDLRRSGRSEIYVVDVAELVPRRLNTDQPDIYLPSWSHDGKWIYFTSNETTGERIYRCPATGGNATALSASPSANPQESFDGKTVYFTTRAVKSPLKKVSLEHPGTESSLEGLPTLQYSGLWTVAPGGIYFVPADSPHSLCYFDFATKQVRNVFEVQKDFNRGLSASPDGHWIIYSQLDEVNSDIMLVDHFH